MEDTIAEITLADRLEAHTEQMANTSWGLTMQEWNVISNDILLAARTLRALDEAQARVERAEAALVFYADESNYIETTLPLDLSQETRKQAPRIGADCGRRAQNALAGKTARLTPTEASDARRVREVVPELIGQLRTDAAKMKPGPERIHVLAASNWLDSLLSRLPTPPAAQTLKERHDG